MLLSQHALRRARTVAGASSVMLVIDPVVRLLAGIAWFDERVVVTPISLVSAVAAGAAVIAGGSAHPLRVPVALDTGQR